MGHLNVRNNKEIKNSEHYIVLDISLKIDYLYKKKVAS